MQPIGYKWWRCVGLVTACWLLAATVNAQKAAYSLDSIYHITPSDTAHLPLQRTQRGVRFVFQERGTGALAGPGHRVAMYYTGFLPDGHVFDASAASGGLLRFRVGRKEVIAGFDELLPMHCCPQGREFGHGYQLRWPMGPKACAIPMTMPAFSFPPIPIWSSNCCL
jgi:hypothetical protein